MTPDITVQLEALTILTFNYQIVMKYFQGFDYN